jgi:flagellar hook-associated protein 3 FlgL
MRITENMVSAQLLGDIGRNREEIVTLQSQLASGRRVMKPSDDPQAADSILRLQAVMDRNEQYLKGIADGSAMMEETSLALNSAAEVLLDVRDELIRASNGTRQESLSVHANRIDQLLSQLVEIANTKFNGKYIFGGTRTLEPPFTLAPDRSAVTANPNGITGSISFAVADGFLQTVNIDGQEAFLGTQMFQTIIQLRDQLANGQFPAPGDVESVNALIEHLLGKASKAGSVVQSLAAQQAHLEEQQNQLRSLLSLDQDTDVPAAVLQLKNKEILLEAALNTGARILPKSLLDFLR